ncbi:MAG: ABC-type transport system involved in resistance to organic solvents periplasmic component [uncultured bacterium]|nr:MAG: ABC-type transport system involved in resistance to organic solvents periplasmic component [uncultured bacterium]
MLSQRIVETTVGLFLLAAMVALLVLAFKVSGLTSFFKVEGYNITAQFDDVGQLKARSTVKIGGVTIGEVTGIRLDPITFKAIVTMHIYSRVNNIPDDSSAAILTAGLLGDNYIAITPMYGATFLKNGSELQDTHSAMILEKLIGQFLFKVGGDSSTKEPVANTANAHHMKTQGETR